MIDISALDPNSRVTNRPHKQIMRMCLININKLSSAESKAAEDREQRSIVEYTIHRYKTREAYLGQNLPTCKIPHPDFRFPLPVFPAPLVFFFKLPAVKIKSNRLFPFLFCVLASPVKTMGSFPLSHKTIRLKPSTPPSFPIPFLFNYIYKPPPLLLLVITNMKETRFLSNPKPNSVLILISPFPFPGPCFSRGYKKTASDFGSGI